MNNRHEFNFEEKHHILVVDGNDYEIPQRTEEISEKLKAHDEKLDSLTEYEANIELLEILFGKTKVKKMFPAGKKTNLDKLSQCTAYAISLYMAEFNRVQTEKLSKKLEEVNPLINQISEVGKTVSDLSQKAEFKKFVSKKK